MNVLRHLSQFFTFSSENDSQTVINSNAGQKGLSKNICHINRVPNEILVKIFAFLDFKSQTKAHSVCNLWHQLIDSMLAIETNVMITDNKKSDEVYDYRSQRVFVLNQFISRKSYKKISSTIISKHFTLISLSLHFNENLYQKNILKLVTNSCNSALKELSVKIDNSSESNLLVDNKEVEIFCQKFANLEVIRLEAFRVLIEQKSFDIMIKKWQQLKTFCVRQLSYKNEGKYKIFDYNGICFRDISPNIEVMKISAFILDRIGVRYFQLNGIHGIKELTIDWMKDLPTLQTICKCCPNIFKLWLSFTPGGLKEENVIDLWSTFGSFKSLKKLSVYYAFSKVAICQHCIKQLANAPELTKLSIETADMTSEAVEAIAQHLPQLEKLCLRSVYLNSEQSIAAISQMKNLKIIRLSTHPDFTEQNLISMINGCPLLKFIDVPMNKVLTTDSMHSLIDRANKYPEDILRINVSHNLSDNFKQFDGLLPNNLIVIYSNAKDHII